MTTRKNPYTHQPQLLTEDILDILRHNLPADAFCTIGITMRDLYPNPSWNFVFGEASLDDRVGVFSFARYDPAFYGTATEDRSLLVCAGAARSWRMKPSICSEFSMHLLQLPDEWIQLPG